jgi:hypothetical protein
MSKRKEREEEDLPRSKRQCVKEENGMEVEVSDGRNHTPLHRPQKHGKLTMERVQAFIGKNHLLPRVYPEKQAMEVKCWHAPDRVSFKKAMKEMKKAEPITVGGTTSDTPSSGTSTKAHRALLTRA